jgi:DNA-binding NarL/FixJ family response regulator
MWCKKAFHLGALGYLAKMHAGIELLAALEATCQGKRFVGSGAQVSRQDSSERTFDRQS